MISFLEAGLEDLSVSRTSFKWGIPVPDDPAHVMYVWFDALTNYMTAAGYGLTIRPTRAVHGVLARRRAPDRQGDRAAACHLLAGHPAWRPACRCRAGRRPRLVADGRREDVEVEGQRRRAPDYVERFGLDGFRYCVYREMIFGQDASFTDEAILARYNADLANDLGNLASG